VRPSVVIATLGQRAVGRTVDTAVHAPSVPRPSGGYRQLVLRPKMFSYRVQAASLWRDPTFCWWRLMAELAANRK